MGETRAGRSVAEPQRAPLGRRDQGLVVRDRRAHRHARALVHVGALARLQRQLRQDLLDEAGHVHTDARVGELAPLLVHHVDLERATGRVVGANLGLVAVLERRDDATASRVVLRIGARDDEHVER
jgi:hypothetical protein